MVNTSAGTLLWGLSHLHCQGLLLALPQRCVICLCSDKRGKKWGTPVLGLCFGGYLIYTAKGSG